MPAKKTKPQRGGGDACGRRAEPSARSLKIRTRSAGDKPPIGLGRKRGRTPGPLPSEGEGH